MHIDLQTPYQKGELPSLQLGGILLDSKLLPDAPVNLVLKSFNRHGLIAGATGTGKTKSIQALCEQLSLAGVPCLVMDIKGDLSGVSMPGESNEGLSARNQSLNLSFNPRGFPVEMFSLSENLQGVPLRATVTDFGSILFSRMLALNETQAGVVTVVFEYAKQNVVPLIDLADMKAILQYVQSDEGKADIESTYGAVSSASVSIILRKIIEIEAQGGAHFFGQPAFNVMDLLRLNSKGEGIISVLRLMDMQDKPKLFSTFMLKLLSDLYRELPELGDPLKPKLVLFIDEAHLIFDEASKALLNMLDTIVKLIRSKGVGLIFCTQTPNDIPDSILSQLGLKVQHALRAFTAKDRQAMKLVAKNFPPSDFYNIEELLTSLGIGEALVSALDGKGQPTPLVQCMVRAPESRMGVISSAELNTILQGSSLNASYSQRKLTPSAKDKLASNTGAQSVAREGSVEKNKNSSTDPSIITIISKNTLFRQILRQVVRDLTNAILKLLKGKSG